jgi:hypothetical protein
MNQVLDVLVAARMPVFVGQIRNEIESPNDGITNRGGNNIIPLNGRELPQSTEMEQAYT